MPNSTKPRRTQGDSLLTSRQAAERLGISVSQVNRLAAAEAIPTAVQIPGLRGARLFAPSDIEAISTNRTEQPAGGP